MKRTVTVMVVATLASVLLAACSGGKSTNSSSSANSNASPAASPAASAASGAMKNAMTGSAQSPGEKVFTANCSSCHQANGKGQPGVFPPLAGNAVVTGDATGVIHIVKDGLNGKVAVHGTAYNGQMPPWKGTLSDSDIAAVVTYIRTAWGNSATAVTESQVAATK